MAPRTVTISIAASLLAACGSRVSSLDQVTDARYMASSGEQGPVGTQVVGAQAVETCTGRAVIGTVEFREERLEVISGSSSGPCFNVLTRSGRALGLGMAENDLAARFPGLYSTYRSARARAFLDARLEPRLRESPSPVSGWGRTRF